MDFGHYNCRDYYHSPHFAPTTIVSDRSPFYRHESFDELEQRSRSPASFKPKFPLLKLPLELRQQIFNYLLPRTIQHSDPNPLASHARNFSAVKKRAAKGMVVPKPETAQRGPTHVVWQRGNIKLLSVCRQIHDECADMMYGRNTFLLFVTYAGITFRYSWLLPTGMTPNRHYSFLELLSEKYMTRIKRVIVNVDHVDSYTGMIKFNVTGKGLTHGLRKQVQRLVNALQPPPPSNEDDEDGYVFVPGDSYATNKGRQLAKVNIRVSNGNVYLDQIKSEAVRQREAGNKISEDVAEMLEPFGDLRGVREVAISGAVTPEFAHSLEEMMRSTAPHDRATALTKTMHDLELASPPICVYGNDL
ncbi:hypothetical protein M409DRAFT_63800 [Zasmidium cellare ATCC 36951]|uniref:DUF7730 domain-containing protein n=1 Tax=Zasmidium cellare ATCC 36951 TaxID=1080233 RepID=A0A6A6CWX8_ZASCE|nr:uncharacterized protein M409DRAFT_63800 [Zasmidium cellare ATCC 36951]KAF2170718.1 hypothetical protein M409DRAFT_63800 [Zasmidium cellare ATCC 36951]